MRRSVSADLELEAGSYSVLMKITAQRYSDLPTPEQTIRDNCRSRQEKLVRIGLAYDLAHARGQIRETEQEKEEKVARQLKKNEALRQKQREELRASKYKQWLISKKWHERKLRHKQRDEEHRRKKGEGEKVTTESMEQTNGMNYIQTIDAPVSNGATVDESREQTNDVNTGETIGATSNVAAEEELAMPATNNSITPRGDTAEDQSTTVSIVGEDSNNSTINGSASNGDRDVSVANNNGTEPTPVEKPVADGFEATHEETLPLKNVDQVSGLNQSAPSEVDQTSEDTVSRPNVPEVSDIAPNDIPRDDYQSQENEISKGDGLPNGYAPGDIVPPDDIPPNENGPTNNDDDTKSETSSLRSFNSSIDDDLDFDPLPDPNQTPEPVPAPSSRRDSDDDDSDYAEFANDPWNAVCVVGLRVFSKNRAVCVGVVSPKKGEDEEEETPLDLDDPSKRISEREGDEEEVKVKAEGEANCGSKTST